MSIGEKISRFIKLTFFFFDFFRLTLREVIYSFITYLLIHSLIYLRTVFFILLSGPRSTPIFSQLRKELDLHVS